MAPRRPLVLSLAALSGVLLSIGLAACGSSSPKAHATPLVAPALIPPKDSADTGVKAATNPSTDTISTISTTDTTGGAAPSSSSGAAGSGTATPAAPATPASPTGGAAPPTPPTTPPATKPTGSTGDKSGGAGAGAFCKQNPGAC